MPGIAWSNRRRLAPLLLLVAVLAAAPRPALSRPAVGSSGHRAALDRVPALAPAQHAATTSTVDDRRPLPLGALPTVAATALLALLAALIVRAHHLATGRRWSAFRRRAPPVLRTAS